MAKGIAITTGLNSVDPSHYGGWSGDLMACEADAEDMAHIAQSKGFEVETLLTDQATRTNLVNAVTEAADALKSGDVFMLSYSDHSSFPTEPRYLTENDVHLIRIGRSGFLFSSRLAHIPPDSSIVIREEMRETLYYSARPLRLRSEDSATPSGAACRSRLLWGTLSPTITVPGT
jgi:Caspase domain